MQNNKILPKPLAELMRPRSIEQFFGQNHLLGNSKVLTQIISSQNIPSIILWGPPGCGKTTLARIIAETAKVNFVEISAVKAGKKEILNVVESAENLRLLNQKTILFIDEIHRFNKAQQDTLLPYMENGILTVIGATTENPSFELNSAILSRSQLFVLNSHDSHSLSQIVKITLQKLQNEHSIELPLNQEIVELLVNNANGDARNLLGSIEILLNHFQDVELTVESVKALLSHKALRYDKNGEEHYNLISAFHKSMRGSDPDAAVYWLVRMLSAGEDPLYLARRMVRFASEDIGLADSNAIKVALAATEACRFIGLPECKVNLVHAAIYLSVSPKSNSAYKALNLAEQAVIQHGNLPVPLHLRNAPTKVMKTLGYGNGYKYAHDFKGAQVSQQHLPDKIQNTKFFQPTNHGMESKIQSHLLNQQS